MENEDSLPYIDDSPTDDETNSRQYNLRIIENYHDRNRNIEITNRCPNDSAKALSPVAPLAEETEFSDSLEEDVCKHVRRPSSKDSGMKLVIRGWNSSISIQGLDNKSSITFKRRCEKVHKKVERCEERNKPIGEETKVAEKSRKGRWKMLTRSIMLAKSARFERKGLDERYPKYVLLKNEEEEVASVKENYPKMFVFSEKDSKPKPEFSFKKSFKNKTQPIIPMDEILSKTEENQNTKPKQVKKQKKALTERNVTIKKKIVVERRNSVAVDKKLEPPIVTGCPPPHGQVCSEIQDIFEDTLKLLPQGTETQQAEEIQQQPQRLEFYTSVPPQFSKLSCHDPYCCLPPKYVPVYPPQTGHCCKNPNTQTRNQTVEDQTANDAEVNLENLPFGFLSTFFPRVVIMNSIPAEELGVEEDVSIPANNPELKNYQLPKAEEEAKDLEEDFGPTLEVPQQDLTLKSKMVRDVKPEPAIQDFFVGDISLKEFEEEKTKSQSSEATEYLTYTEFDPPENESIDRPTPLPANKSPAEEPKIDESTETLSLTKIGYKMYDNLTKLSLNREKEITQKPEATGCGCKGNGTKKSPYNITLESNNSIVKVAVPENELNFQFVNSEGGDIQIGVTKSGRGKKQEEEEDEGKEEKKVVRKEELWHPDDGRRAVVVSRGEESQRGDVSSKGFQKLKVSLADNQEVVFVLGTNEREKKEEKPKEKSTKEVKVGTDDFDLAGGDFVCALGGNHRNLSPRLSELLKHLHEKLEIGEKERKFLDEKINQKLTDQKFQQRILPGVFLVKQISPRLPPVKKPPEISYRKPKKDGTEGGLREYYCEECLATMRIFEDENPSVKSMVDKFETIIQLESY